MPAGGVFLVASVLMLSFFNMPRKEAPKPKPTDGLGYPERFGKGLPKAQTSLLAFHLEMYGY